MKIVIIATEPSGDYLGFHLIKSLKKKKKVSLYGVGGKLMKSQNFKSWVPMEQFNTIGLFEVLIRLPKFLKILNIVVEKIIELKPDIILTIDSPSFNYRVIKKIKHLRNEKKVKIFHYVAPTVWAWKKYRAKIFSNLYDKLFTLFEFENKYFINCGLKTKWVGHQIFFEKPNIIKQKVICFLPGSRETEIAKNLKKMKPIIINTLNKYKNYKIFILNFENQKKLIQSILHPLKIDIITKFDQKQKILSKSNLAIAASGSISLELCKYKIPSIIVYDTNILTRIILKALVKIDYCTLINIFFNKEVIPEFLFENFNFKNVTEKIHELLNNKNKRKQQIEYMEAFQKKMVGREKPSEIIANELLKK